MRSTFLLICFGMAFLAWFFLGFNGVLSEGEQTAIGETRLIAAVLMLAGAVIFCLPERPK